MVTPSILFTCIIHSREVLLWIVVVILNGSISANAQYMTTPSTIHIKQLKALFCTDKHKFIKANKMTL